MIYDLHFSCEEIAKAVNGKLIGENNIVNALSIDSREKSHTNYCYFAIKGTRYDGEEFVQEAISNGAGLIITCTYIKANVPVIIVRDTTVALGMLAHYHKGKTKIIGVTGSNGKTTTKDMIKSVLETKYSVCATKENNNNEIGVALTLLSIQDEDYCVVEMGMRGKGEIDWLSKICEPSISVITNCNSAHIGRLGSEKNIFEAKTEILNYTKEYAILPSEERFKELNFKGKKLYVGENGDYYPHNIIQKISGVKFDIKSCLNIEIDSIYRHDAMNATFAFAVGKLCNISEEMIKDGLSNFKKHGCRGEVYKVNGVTVIDDSYNASYESMKEAIISVKNNYADKRIAVLLGDMLELGEFSRDMHLKIGRLCRKIGVDLLFAYGEQSEHYLQGFGAGERILDYKEIVKTVFSKLNESFVLLIKASNKVKFHKLFEKERYK